MKEWEDERERDDSSNSADINIDNDSSFDDKQQKVYDYV